MGDAFVFCSSNDDAPDAKCRGHDGLVMSPMKRRLKDITNLQQKPRVSNLDGKYKVVSSFSDSEQIHQLLKEKMVLMKQIADCNKIIDLTQMELQKLRPNLQQVQQQNWHLARTNSQILAELTAGKDKLRVLQHELGCAKSQLAVRNAELQAEKEIKHQQTVVGIQQKECEEAEGPSEADVNDNKPRTSRRQVSRVGVTSIGKGSHMKEKSGNRRTGEMEHMQNAGKDVECVLTKGKSENRRRSLRRQSSMFETGEMESVKDELKTDEGILTQERSENRRHRLRRVSSRFKAGAMESTEDTLEMDDIQCPLASSVVKTDIGKVDNDESAVQESTVDARFALCLELHGEKNNDSEKVEGYGTQEDIRRTSLGRPLRRAAVKVQSYKEAPLNKKIRRPN